MSRLRVFLSRLRGLDIEEWRTAAGVFAHIGMGRLTGSRPTLVDAGVPERGSRHEPPMGAGSRSAAAGTVRKEQGRRSRRGRRSRD
jgi:hypothetical protein